MTDERHCSCGQPVTKAEIRVVERCAHGHFVASSIAPTTIDMTLVAPKPMTPGQRRGFHGKANRLDKLLGVQLGTSKKRLLGDRSTSDLTETEASDLLDQLEAELADAISTAPAGGAPRP